MPHDLSIKSNGSAELALGYGLSAWHGLGTVFDGAIPLEDAIATGIPFEAIKEQLIRPSTGQESTAWGIYRSDTGAEIGTSKAAFELIQPREMFNFTQGLNIPGYESAGALEGGKKLFVLARVGEINVLGSGDITRTYLAFINSFDGTMAAQIYLTGTRIVCRNTYDMSLRDQKGRVLKFKHTKEVHNKLDQAQAEMILTSKEEAQRGMQAAFDLLATKKLKREGYESLLEKLWPGEATKAKNVREDVTTLFIDNDNNYIPEFAGTAYAALNAITNYVDHKATVVIRSQSATKDIQSRRFESAILDTGATRKREALEYALVLANDSNACIDSPYTSLPPRDVTPLYLPSVDTSYTSATDSRTGYSNGADDAPHMDHNPYNYHLNEDGIYTNDSEPNIDTIDDMSREQSDYYEDLTQDAQPTDVANYLYTTADTSCDLPGTVTERIVEQINSTIALRRVSVPEGNLQAQITAYKLALCLAETVEQWLRRGKGE